MAFSAFKRIFNLFHSYIQSLIATADANTPEQFLELIKTCSEQAQKMTTPSAFSSSPKFNSKLCKYLAAELKLAEESARSFINRGFRSPEERVECLDIFKLFHALANVAEDVIRSCCQDAWIEAAFLMTNASEHILSMSFDLEMLTHFFSGSLTSTELVDSVFRAEVAIVKKNASHDRETLRRDVTALLETKVRTSTEYQLAALLLKRLETRGENLADSLVGAHRTDMESLKEVHLLGKGAFGTVFKAMWLGVEVAKKTFYAPSTPDFENEVSILGRLSHPSITSLLCYGGNERECFMVMELMDGDLSSTMRSIMVEDKALSHPFNIMEAVDIMLQVGVGMEYLREMKIVHRDLKAMNILVRRVQGRETKAKMRYTLAKLSDFGLSRTKENSMTYSCQTPNTGTPRWMAPEMIKLSQGNEQIQVSNDTMNAKYPFRGDVFSFAMVCYEILTGEVPYFEVRYPNEVKKKILKGERPQLPSYCPPKLQHLIERCWSQDASKRPRFGEICVELRHLKCLLLMSFNMVDTEKEAAVQELGSTGVQPSSDFSLKASKSQQQPEWKRMFSSASAATSGPSPNTEAASDDNKQEASTSGSNSDEGASSDRVPGQITKRPHFEYVIGLHFGSTWSAVALSKLSRFCDDGKIDLIRDWPGRNDYEYYRVLTALYYKRTELGQLKYPWWGYTAQSEYNMDLRHGPQRGGQGVYLTEIQALLNDPDLARCIPAPLMATDIITDYLKLIGEHALSVVRDRVSDAVFSKDSVLWCVTVPSSCDENAKQQVRACMVNAGLVSAQAGGIEAVKVVLEPEAASFFCYYIGRFKDVPLNAKDKILLTDLSNGIVETVVQELVDGRLQNYQVKELAKCSNGLCGETFLEESSLRFLSKRIPCLDEYLKDIPSFKRVLLMDLERIKCAFGHKMMLDTDTVNICLPPTLGIKWEAYETERGNTLDDPSKVELTEQDLKSIFDPVVDKILELIDAQLAQVPDVKAMFVVGGSPYLMKRIQAHFGGRVPDIVCPPIPDAAIVRGAVSLLCHRLSERIKD